MTGRQNEYFIPGDGISREVIQADICRFLGNDALVRPGNYEGRQGFFIRAYRNLTTEMINDLKDETARWEAEVARRADLGHPRGSYVQDVKISHAPNSVPNYATSARHEIRQSQGPSPPTFSATPAQPYVDAYSQSPYSGTQNAPFNNPSSYSSSHSPYGSGQAPYPPPQVSYSAPSQPVVTAADIHPASYTYSTTGYGYEGGGGGRNAPRYPGPGYDDPPEYSPATSGMAYPASTAPDPRIGMEARYTPEYEQRRPQPARERDPHRRR